MRRMSRHRPTLRSAMSAFGLNLDSIRFGRQARLGERVDSGLTASRLSEFATLDKMRLKYKTRLGRFITSPRRLAVLRSSPPSPQFPLLILGSSMYCVKGVSEKTLAWKLILAKAPIARTYSAARWGSGEHCSPDGGWGNAPVLL